MGDSGANNRRSWSPSPRWDDDEDADFQLALKLSAELNGELGGHAEAAAAAAKRQAQYDDDFDLTVDMQFNDRGSRANNRIFTRYPGANASSSTPVKQTAIPGPKVTITEPENAARCTFKSFADFQKYIKEIKCSECGAYFFEHQADAEQLFKRWYDGTRGPSSFLKCNKCGTSSCIVCPSTASSRRSMALAGDKSVSWCCNDGRLILIWVLLCGFDISYCETKARLAKETNAANNADAPKQTSKSPSKPEGKGKGKAKAAASAQHRGIGYGGSDNYSGYMYNDDSDAEDSDMLLDADYSHFLEGFKKKSSRFETKGAGRTISDAKSQGFEAQQAIDKLATTVLGLLRYLLPSPNRENSFDRDPPVIVPDILSKSKILDYCTELLRNDSLDDAFLRKVAYDAALDFVRVIARNHITANLTIFSGRLLQPEQCNLLTQTYHDIEVMPTGTGPSVVSSLRELSKLSELLLKNAAHHEKVYKGGNDLELLSLCRKISNLWMDISACIARPDAEDLNHVTQNTLTVEAAAIKDVDDDQICASHAFADRAKAQFRSAPGRFKRLVSEINVLKTSLPPNIFVRHGESRLDVMKCAIIGPADTPYENGIFEFDVYCTAEYPNVPPQVSFKGTAGGRVGINPNLYADGKVCLSLLGTWQGEPWKPGQSTLLQVLVSLQAMVFCEEPWYNEPGREHGYGKDDSKSASDSYNRGLREHTVRLALLGWLEKPPQIWEDVVQQHFRANADKILRTVIEWHKQSKPSRHRFKEWHTFSCESGYNTLLPALHEHLQKYGATVALPDLPKEDTEPQPKRPRVEGSDSANGPSPGAQGPSELYADYYKDAFDYTFDEDSYDTQSYFPGTSAASDLFQGHHQSRGGYRGRSSYYPGFSFRGRGQVLGAGPADAPSAPSGLFGGGRGRGHGLFSSMLGLGRGSPSLPPPPPYTSYHDLRYGPGKTLGGGDGTADGSGRGGGPARGGRGGLGGRGGNGSSKA